MHAVFNKAVWPTTRSVLGLELKPLSLGHVFELHKHTTLLSDADPTLSQLTVGVFLCSMDWKESSALISRFRTRLFTLYWGFRCRHMDFQTEHNMFMSYLNESLEQAEWKLDPQRIRHLSSPWFMRLTALLMARLSMTLDEAKSIHLQLATALLTALEEADNDVELWSESDESMWQQATRN